MPASHLLIGWASADVTPSKPALIVGQFYARISEGVMDPVTATALALESVHDGRPAERVVMVSCDYVSIPDSLRDAVRQRLRALAPDLDPMAVFLGATHSHTGPEVRTEEDCARSGDGFPNRFGFEIDAMDGNEYVPFAADRIAQAVAGAWKSRAPGAIGYGLGQATLGHNRRMCFDTGETRMYGNPNDPHFSHIEGSHDPSVNILYTWDNDRRLTGVLVNVACTAQVSMHEFLISADYWHEARLELRRRLGQNLHVLPQISPAGDLNPIHPRITIGWPAQERMWRLMGRTQRQDMAVRIADAVTSVLPYAEKEMNPNPCLMRRVETIPLSRRKLTQKDVDEALAEAAPWRAKYEALRAELEANPALRQQPRWYVPISTAFRKMRWNEKVADRFEQEKTQPTLPFEVHALRIGDVAFATNPFEYYLDFAYQIKARARAVQTFTVQLVGGGGYLPTERATAGKSYGAVPASTPIGPQGGKELVEWTVQAINAFWPDPAPKP